MIRLLLLVTALALVLAPGALASEERPTLEELEKELICPTCHALLALSDAPVADQIRASIRARIEAGDSKTEIKDALVAEFGEAVLAAPPKEGLNLLAWLLPLAGIAAAGGVVFVVTRRWVRYGRGRDDGPPAPETEPLAPELDERVDDELSRFDY